MEIFLVITIVLVLGGFGVVLFMLVKLKEQAKALQNNEQNQLMLDFMRELKTDAVQTRDSMQQNIHETNRQINDRLTEAARVIGMLHKEMGSMSQIGPDIRRLSEVLAGSKSRGNFGEEMLEAMIEQVLPREAFSAQYRFKNGEVVDMVIKVGERLLPIDSKFSMENFRLYLEAKTEDSAEMLKKAFIKDVKKRIDEIYKKYILPQEGTFDFALMYVQSESLFNEVLADPGLMGYAREKHVYLVSPNTLYHHLHIVLTSLRGQRINEMAHQVMRMIAGVRQESEKFGKSLDVLSTHVKNAGNAMGTVQNEFVRLRSSIETAARVELEAEKEKQVLLTNE